jgi:hypothetical protein
MRKWRYSSTIFDLGTRWRWVVSLTPQSLYPRGKIPGTHGIRGWVGPRAGLDDVERRNISCPCRDSNPGRPARRYTDWSILAPRYGYAYRISHTIWNRTVTNWVITRVGWYTKVYVTPSRLLAKRFLALRNPTVRTYLEHISPLCTKFKQLSLSY